MKNRNLKYTIFGLTAVFILNSCSLADRFEEMNVNKNAPTKVSPEVLLTNVEVTTFNYLGGFGDGFIGQFSQHFAGNHATGIEYDLYQLTNGSFSYLFTDSYLGGLKDCERIINTAPAGYEKFKGVAKILTAYKLGYLTTLYGDIPYSEALNENNTKPKYDSQESIYASIQTLLSQAVTDLDAGSADLKGDFLYDNDATKWKAVAYMLSARFYNHYSKKDPMGSANKALAAIDNAKKFGMTSSSMDLLAKFDGSASFTNPWVSMYNNGMVVANKPYIDRLVASNDPRLNMFFCSVEHNGANVFGIGKIQSGAIGTGKYAMMGGVNSYYGKSDSSIPAASYAEMLMIEAEAALRAGNPTRAAQAHNEGIKAHVNQISDAATAVKDAYFTTYASETSSTITLEKIMTEKHKIMTAMSVESWMDFRRHDHKYPTWSSIPLNEAETASVSSKYIERILYPQSELNNNKANVPASTIYDKLPILR